MNMIVEKIIPIYIGITTTPERLKLRLTSRALDSILKNSYQPIKIILTIPKKNLKNEEYPLEILNELPFRLPNIILNIIEEDLGPISKINGLLNYIDINLDSNLKNQIKAIILMDDDIIYPKDSIKILWEKYLLCNIDQKNNKSIGLAGRKWNIKKEDLEYFKFQNIKSNEIFIKKVDILETYHLVIHPYSIFQNNINKWNNYLKYIHNISSDSVFTDDIVISLWLKIHNIDRYLINGFKVKEIKIKTEELKTINLYEGRNNKVYNKLFIENLNFNDFI